MIKKIKIFISYSRVDTSLSDNILKRLDSNEIEITRDVEDIFPSEEWEKRITDLIISADSVIAFISENYLSSKVCNWEIELANKYNKKIVPIILKRKYIDKIPEYIKKLNYIYINDSSDINNTIKKIEVAIKQNIPWVREHTRYSELSTRWNNLSQLPSSLLHGKDLLLAENWRDSRPSSAPRVTDLQLSYITTSRKAYDNKQRKLLLGSLFLLIVFIALLIYSYIQRDEAILQSKDAKTRLIESNHNFGISLLEKAEDALNKKDYNLSKVFALHAADKVKQQSQEEVRANSLLSMPSFPVSRMTPTTIHNNANLYFIKKIQEKNYLSTVSDVGLIRVWDMLSRKLIFEMELSNYTDDKVINISYLKNNNIYIITESGNTYTVEEGSKKIVSNDSINNDFDRINTSSNGEYLVTIDLEKSIVIRKKGKKRKYNLFKKIKTSFKSIEILSFSTDSQTFSIKSGKEVIFYSLLDGSVLYTIKDKKYSLVNNIIIDKKYALIVYYINDYYQVDIVDVKNKITKFTINNKFKNINSTLFKDSESLIIISNNSVYKYNIGKFNLTPSIIVNGICDSNNSVIGIKNILYISCTSQSIQAIDLTRKKIIKNNNGHTSTVFSSDFTSDGRKFATSSEDLSIKIWDSNNTSVPLKTLQYAHQSIISTVLFTPNNKYLISKADNSIKIWDTETWTIIKKIDIKYRGSLFRNIAISPDSKLFASGLGNSLKIWSIASGELIKTLDGHTGAIWTIAWSHDGKTIATGSRDQTIRLWEYPSGKSLKVFDLRAGSITSLAFSANDKYIAGGTWKNYIQIWDIDEESYGVLQDHTDMVTGLSFMSNSDNLVSVAKNGELRITDLDSAESVMTTRINGTISSISLSPNDKVALITSNDHRAYLWDIDLENIQLEKFKLGEYSYQGVFSSDGENFAIANNEHKIQYLDYSTRKEVSIFDAHSDVIRKIVLSDDKSTMASSSSDGNIKIYDIKSTRTLATIPHPDLKSQGWGVSSISGQTPETSLEMNLLSKAALSSCDIDLSPDGSILASGSYIDNSTMLFNNKGLIIDKLNLHSSMVNCVKFSNSGKQIAIGYSDGYFLIWNIINRSIDHNFMMPHGYSVSRIIFSKSDDKVIVSSSKSLSNSSKILLIDLSTGEILSTITTKQKEEEVKQMCLSPNEKILAVVSKSPNSFIELWNLREAKLMSVIKTQPTGVDFVKFSKLGDRIISFGFFDNIVQDRDISHLYKTKSWKKLINESKEKFKRTIIKEKLYLYEGLSSELY